MVDLKELKAGDNVMLESGFSCSATHIQPTDSGIYTVHLANNELGVFFVYVDKNGNTRNGYNKIVEIIPNPRRWTDDDMKAAYNGGINDEREENALDSAAWLEQYKAGKK